MPNGMGSFRASPQTQTLQGRANSHHEVERCSAGPRDNTPERPRRRPKAAIACVRWAAIATTGALAHDICTRTTRTALALEGPVRKNLPKHQRLKHDGFWRRATLRCRWTELAAGSVALHSGWHVRHSCLCWLASCHLQRRDRCAHNGFATQVADGRNLSDEAHKRYHMVGQTKADWANIADTPWQQHAASPHGRQQTLRQNAGGL